MGNWIKSTSFKPCFREYEDLLERMSDDIDYEPLPAERNLLKRYAQRGVWVGMSEGMPYAMSVDAEFLETIA